jgi:TonB family protein
VGAVTLNVSDFPHAWYLRVIHQKISERWEGRARDGQQPVAVFEIRRDGQVIRLAIEKTSGNAVYDQAALRAIAEASPFPELPPDFKEPLLRVHLGFNFAGSRG